MCIRDSWWGGILVGLVIPAALVILTLALDISSAVPAAIAGVLAIIGLYAYEDSFVRAGQSVPLS